MRARASFDWGAARQVDMAALARPDLGARLRQSGKFLIGACPIGHASCDGFVVNPGRNLFLLPTFQGRRRRHRDGAARTGLHEG